MSEAPRKIKIDNHYVDPDIYLLWRNFSKTRRKQIIDIAINNAIANSQTEFKYYDTNTTTD